MSGHLLTQRTILRFGCTFLRLSYENDRPCRLRALRRAHRRSRPYHDLGPKIAIIDNFSIIFELNFTLQYNSPDLHSGTGYGTPRSYVSLYAALRSSKSFLSSSSDSYRRYTHDPLCVLAVKRLRGHPAHPRDRPCRLRYMAVTSPRPSMCLAAAGLSGLASSTCTTALACRYTYELRALGRCAVF
jgi:hypothetical protein